MLAAQSIPPRYAPGSYQPKTGPRRVVENAIMSPQETLQVLVSRLQTADDEVDIVTLQEAYQQLRAVFAHVLFSLKKAPTDHYAWLLLDQDAGQLLDRLVLAHQVCPLTRANPIRWRAYQRDLADFHWIIATAMLCQP